VLAAAVVVQAVLVEQEEETMEETMVRLQCRAHL
jgi:hypothetical protein